MEHDLNEQCRELNNIVRHWQKFRIKLGVKLGCTGIDTDVEAAVTNLVAERDRLKAALKLTVEALEGIHHTVEESEQWWMDCPDKGGIDLTLIEAALAAARKEMGE